MRELRGALPSAAGPLSKISGAIRHLRYPQDADIVGRVMCFAHRPV